MLCTTRLTVPLGTAVMQVGAKKKSPNNPTNASHEKSGDKDGDADDKDGDVKNKDANEGDDDSSSPKSADPCEGGQ